MSDMPYLSDKSRLESDMADEVSDNIKPWTIRGVPPEERNAAIEAAKRSDMNLGDWLRQAIRTQIQQEKQGSKAVVAVGQPRSDKPSTSDRAAERLLSVERIAATMRDLAASGAQVPGEHVAQVTAALAAMLPRLPPRKSDKIGISSDRNGNLSDTKGLGRQPIECLKATGDVAVAHKDRSHERYDER